MVKRIDKYGGLLAEQCGEQKETKTLTSVSFIGGACSNAWPQRQFYLTSIRAIKHGLLLKPPSL